jgi:hypothetical protein
MKRDMSLLLVVVAAAVFDNSIAAIVILLRSALSGAGRASDNRFLVVSFVRKSHR